jgi:drug/metabolite transporter (DMT)-like permease
VSADAAALRRANLKGALAILGASLVFAVVGLLVRQLGQRHHGIEITVFRYAVCMLLVLAFVPGSVREALHSPRRRLHLIRGACGAGGVLGFTVALALLPLAQATAILFSAPLFMMAFAVMAMGERGGLGRWSAAGVGFLGAVLVARPEAEIGPGVIAAAIGAVLMGVQAALIKRLGHVEPPRVLLAAFNLVGLALMLPFLPFVWIAPSGEDLVLLVAVGLLTALGQLLDILGFREGELTVVAPFSYSQLVFAALLGLVVLGERPDAQVILGSTIMVASQLYLLAADRPRRSAERRS